MSGKLSRRQAYGLVFGILGSLMFVAGVLGILITGAPYFIIIACVGSPVALGGFTRLESRSGGSR
ncbi:MAG: hypothetical protein JWN70_2576 [Planctomycetaceae bacterium]|nr:hypothetical protein [Planctomycetaceae bacterium]